MSAGAGVPSAQPLQADIDAYLRSVDACNQGRPRDFMERYLWIDGADGLVPFKLTPNQEYYYRETFGKLRHYDEPLFVVLWKDRSAEWTSFIKRAGFAFLWCCPGFTWGSAADKMENAIIYQAMLDTCYANLPEWMTQNDDRIESWRETRRVIKHIPSPGQVSFASVMVGSPHTGGFGRGSVLKMIDYDEAGLYEPAYEKKLLAGTEEARVKAPWRFWAGTPPEDVAGASPKDTQLYILGQALREKQAQGVFLRRYWFQNAANSLSPGSLEALPEDKRDVAPGDATRPGGETELALLQRFPQDGVPPADRLRWRRQAIWKAVKRRHNRPDLGYISFQVEHAEDDVLCWMGGSAASIGLDAQQAMLARQERPMTERDVAPGLTLRVARKPIAGASYGGVLDPSEGKAGGDPSAFCIFDRDSGMEVAHLYGRAHPHVVLKHAVALIREYNEGVFCPLITGSYTWLAEEAFRMGYVNVWRRPLRKGEDPDSSAYRNRDYGFMETGQQETIRSAFLEQVDTGALWTPFRECQEAWFGFDWSTREHKPDLTVCAGVFAAMRYTIPVGRREGVSGVTPLRQRRLPAPTLASAAGRYASHIAGADGGAYRQ